MTRHDNARLDKAQQHSTTRHAGLASGAGPNEPRPPFPSPGDAGEQGRPLALRTYVSAATLARLWQVHRATVERRLRGAGILPTRIGGARRYLLEEVEGFVRQNSPPPRGRRPLL